MQNARTISNPEAKTYASWWTKEKYFLWSPNITSIIWAGFRFDWHRSSGCRHVSNSPKSLLWGSLLEETRLAAICSGRVPGACPPCVRHTLSAMRPLFVRLASALGAVFPPCVRLVTLESALAPPPYLARQGWRLTCAPHAPPTHTTHLRTPNPKTTRVSYTF